MYFKRFIQKDLDIAIANESITTEHVVRIFKFYNNDIFVLKGLQAVQMLKSIIPDVTQMDYQADEDLYHLQVNSWPHIKPMCLKFAKQIPSRWIYVSQDDDQILFRYDLDNYSIELPS